MYGWRVYYGDGTTVDSNAVSPHQVEDGVVGIVEFLDPPYRKIVDGGDWFYWDEGRWCTTDTIWNGWVDPPQNVGDKLIKQGLGLEDERYEELRHKMLEDRQWP